MQRADPSRWGLLPHLISTYWPTRPLDWLPFSTSLYRFMLLLTHRSYSSRPTRTTCIHSLCHDSAARTCRCQPRSTCCISQRRAERNLQTARTLACALTSTRGSIRRSLTTTILHAEHHMLLTAPHLLQPSNDLI